ncbi:MAG: hypothetical protein ACJLUP_05865 [Agrobacterium tumefaciens]
MPLDHFDQGTIARKIVPKFLGDVAPRDFSDRRRPAFQHRSGSLVEADVIGSRCQSESKIRNFLFGFRLESRIDALTLGQALAGWDRKSEFIRQTVGELVVSHALQLVRQQTVKAVSHRPFALFPEFATRFRERRSMIPRKKYQSKTAQAKPELD